MWLSVETDVETQPDDAALVLPVSAHVEEAAVCNGEDVRRQFPQPPVRVHVHMLDGVDGQQLVRVHCHQDGACVCLWSREWQANASLWWRKLGLIRACDADLSQIRHSDEQQR